MKKPIALLLFFVLAVSCKQQIAPPDAAKLNGYWEIEKVVFPDGKEKAYSMNETIDFFEVKNNSGFRKKVAPQLDGKYLENGHSEQVKLDFTDDKAWVNYTTEYAKWKEEITEITESVLVMKNDKGIEYHYKRPIPFSIK